MYFSNQITAEFDIILLLTTKLFMRMSQATNEFNRQIKNKGSSITHSVPVTMTPQNIRGNVTNHQQNKPQLLKITTSKRLFSKWHPKQKQYGVFMTAAGAFSIFDKIRELSNINSLL